MTPQDIDGRLTEILTDLYPDAGGIVSIARHVGYESETIDFSGSAYDIWGRVVRWGRSHRQLRALLEYALADAPLREDLQQLALAEAGRSEKDRAVEYIGVWILENLRAEMKAMEERLTRRMDEVEAKVDRLQAVTLQFTEKKRAAWLTAFVLFCLPMLLFIQEIRTAIEVGPIAAVAIMSLTWSVSAMLFAYGLGFLRDL